MCGIAGFFGPFGLDQLRSCVDAIRHRGPDYQGVEMCDNEVGLGHARLAIIDLSPAGQQPMWTHDQSCAIVFNGEIYNYRELKHELESEFSFTSSTDTEVLLYAYRKWGKDMLSRINGMFSFVIYDKTKQQLFGARDRLGKKPLKYRISNNSFCFCSEIKGLLRLMDESPAMDPVAIDQYLTLQYIPAPRTGLSGVHKLPPAHWFTYSPAEGFTSERYWQLDYSRQQERTEAQWQHSILQTLEQAVLKRLMSDVPLGAFLSGGIDSSAVVAFMARNQSTPVRTFSIGFDDPRFDETTHAQTIATMYKTDHTEFRVTADMLLEGFDTICDIYDEPLADNSILPTTLLCQLTRSSVTVALSGDGGDENFAGYDRHAVVRFGQMYEKIPGWLRRGLIAPSARALYGLKPTKTTERAARFGTSFSEPFHRRYVNYNCFFTNQDKWELYTPEFRQAIGDNDAFEVFAPFRQSQWDEVDQALYYDCNTYLPEDLQYKMDAASMASSLEVRSPFLDHELLELTATIPSELKIRRGDKKYILKKALTESGILPKSVVYRPKQGFIIPIGTWFKGPLKDHVREAILSPDFLAAGVFDPHALTRYVDHYFTSEKGYDNNMFALLFLSGWYSQYISN